jgi:serine/threonine protein kinase
MVGKRGRPAASPTAGPHWDVDVKVGEGTYGSVYRGVDRRTGAVVALKRMRVAHQGISQSALREISLLRRLRHENIVRLHDVHLEREEGGVRCLLVYEHVASDLAHRIRAARAAFLAPAAVRGVTAQLLAGLAHLHERHVMHRDIKPANLLVSADELMSRLKIADFGLARTHVAPLRALHLDGPVVTVWYRAPELLLGALSHSPAVDLWAAGCVLAECLLTRAAFQGKEAKDELQQSQLRSIFRVLGLPREREWAELASLRHWATASGWADDDEFRDVLEPWVRKHAPAAGPAPSDAALRLLRGLLRYAPEARLAAPAALKQLRLEWPEPEGGVG